MPKPSTSSETKRKVAKRLIESALDAADPASVLSALPEITVKTESGQLLKIASTGKSSATARLVSGDKTIDATPTGTFVLRDRQTIRIEEGRVVGGRPNPGETKMWLTFALMPADRERAGR